MLNMLMKQYEKDAMASSFEQKKVQVQGIKVGEQGKLDMIEAELAGVEMEISRYDNIRARLEDQKAILEQEKELVNQRIAALENDEEQVKAEIQSIRLAPVEDM